MGLPTRGEAWAVLAREYGGGASAPTWRPVPREEHDFCRMPPDARPFYREDDVRLEAGHQVPADASPMQRFFVDFVRRQWGTDAADPRWALRWCLTGPYAFRVVVPVLMDHKVVGFQARSVRGGKPKYLTSRSGPPSDPAAECGRPAGAMVFNLDGLRQGHDMVLVEGPGDVTGWYAGPREVRGVHRTGGVGLEAAAILGQALTPAKLSLLAARRPARVWVALDAEPEARRRAALHVEDLLAWGVDAAMGEWVGAKDAGAGAALDLTRRPPEDPDLIRGAPLVFRKMRS